jgi:hypothetical protein
MSNESENNTNEKYEKYEMLEYLAQSTPHDAAEYRTEAKALLDLMGTTYTAMGFPIILREMVNQNIKENYQSRNKSGFRGNTQSTDEKIKAAGKKFSEAFEEALTVHWEEE